MHFISVSLFVCLDFQLDILDLESLKSIKFFVLKTLFRIFYDFQFFVLSWISESKRSEKIKMVV